ncbi:MAG: hypothetical protein P1V81_12270, partial [Planctomycetota bacterium]|nr:hypothetical protein [Planctomycetota bacterium]
FCMLDEVDAALDDANIERFLTMIGFFRKMSQFIIVTHNKGTMASCDALYGITMQPRGISRHVVMQLSDVDEFVPDAEGKPKVEGAGAQLLDEDTGEPITELEPVARVEGESSPSNPPEPADLAERGPAEVVHGDEATPSVADDSAGGEGGVTTPEGAVASPRAD